MNVKVSELMAATVMKTTPSQTVGHVRRVMREKKVSSMPVVGPDDEPLGIITASDMLEDLSDDKPISQVISHKVFTVPEYADISQAARLMRNQRIHHLIVTRDKKIVGILSTFDILKLVEDRRFVMKNPPSTPKKTRRRSGGRPETTI